MEAAVADVATCWEQRPKGKAFDMLAEMAGLTAEIIAQAVFGQKLGSVAAHSVVAGFSRYQQLIDSVNLGYFLGADEGWPILRGLRLRRALAQIHGVIDKVITDHLANGEDENSMVAMLFRRQNRNPALGLDLDALRSEAATIFMAGHEGTTATLTWAWYLIANAPWAEEAVHHEIATVIGNRAPTVSDVPKLDWCRAVIEETLRLYPSIPIMARQAYRSDRVGTIDIEPAALVMIVPWLLHRANDLWHRPNDFLPERFLGTQRPQAYTYLPFGAGPRVCPGASFGLTESILCLATLAQRFRVRVVEGFQVDPHCRLSLRPRGGLPVIAESRR
jgi:cytochrome P450